jgi:cytochrome b subunit of formate dehydrogenase
MSEVADQKTDAGGEQDIIRHTMIDRMFHWVTAVTVLILLFTAFLPIIGLKFSWLTAHWISGLALTGVVAAHIVRSCFWQDLRAMIFGLEDIKEIQAAFGWLLKLQNSKLVKPGKYSPAQKLVHLGVGLTIPITIVTGLLMMVKIDTPLWERDLYWLSDQNWGIIYVLHGFSALFLMVIVIIHIYFSLRPEKLMYTRAMLTGRLTRAEFLDQHDPERWQN